MSYHAIISSPLGDILLVAGGRGLEGLYFTDQRDCPQVPGLAAARKVVTQPSAGSWHGRATKSLKVMSSIDGPVAGDLPFRSGPQAVHSGSPAHKGAPQVLELDAPAQARAVFEQTCCELEEYWRGERKVFDLPLAPQGTPFQQKVWKALLDVPCGCTLSYGELGVQAGLGDGHGRAVGTAVGSNPISIVIPCHRILARNRTLNGYGGGLDRKLRLLQLEGLTIQ
ncbi:MAG TPA: methylated-DNA--[protein]-cysteine S-methyltransferase [Castellaniella sp.]|uniref:methylated-DNA--[protein]-cysteine S-methyltransferase n=1 Tax=Castellaniella sp. TaxID=1955812 RepID=UPI002EEDE154